MSQDIEKSLILCFGQMQVIINSLSPTLPSQMPNNITSTADKMDVEILQSSKGKSKAKCKWILMWWFDCVEVALPDVE